MNNKFFFCCPVCKGELLDNDKYVSCENNHCFDKAKKGYVNLLLSQKSSKARHGDDRLMIQARQDFLDKGYYKNLCDFVSKTVLKHSQSGIRILDAGCGEGYYLSSISTLLKSNNINAEFGAVDISKDALKFTMARNKEFFSAVASVFNLPVKSNSVDIITNIFSPAADSEYFRVLKPKGKLIRVTPKENHLLELKQAIYDKALKNDILHKEIGGFSIISENGLTDEIEINNNQDIKNLFMMTPYYYKTGKADQEKLEKLDFIKVRTEFDITVYEKNG